MKKKPPGQKSIVTGVSLPPDLHAWLTAHANEPSPDPTSTRSASRIVQQALLEYRERIEKAEAEAREAALGAAGKPAEGKARSAVRNAMRTANAGAKTIRPSESLGISSSTAGMDRYRRTG